MAGTIKEGRVAVRMFAITFATIYLGAFLFWVVLSILSIVAWPGFGWVFFAGMEFEYLFIFVIGPMTRGRDPYEV